MKADRITFGVIGAVIVLAIFAILGSVAHAADYEQLLDDTNTSVTSSLAADRVLWAFYNLTGDLETYTSSWSRGGSGGSLWSAGLIIYECTVGGNPISGAVAAGENLSDILSNHSCSDVTPSFDEGSTISVPETLGVPTRFTKTASSTLTFNNDYWYLTLWYENSSSGTGDLNGGAVSSVNSTTVIKCRSTNACTEGTLMTPYFEINTTYTPPTGLTRVVSLNEPTNGDITGSTTVTFDFDIFNYTGSNSNGIASEWVLQINDLTNLQSLVPLTGSVLSSGNSSVSTSTTLTEGNFYQWRVFLRDENLNTIDTSSWSYFSVVSAPQSDYTFWLNQGTTSTSSVSDLTLECNAEGLVANSICNLAVKLFVPSPSSIQAFYQNITDLGGKLPFSLATEFWDAYYGASIDTDQPSTTLSLDLSSVYAGSDDIDILSESTLTFFVGVGVWSTIYQVMGWMMWFAFAYYTFFRVRSVFVRS